MELAKIWLSIGFWKEVGHIGEFWVHKKAGKNVSTPLTTTYSDHYLMHARNQNDTKPKDGTELILF